MVLMLERREKGKKAAVTRCVILVPTTELGVQCIEVSIKLVGMFFSTVIFLLLLIID